MASGIKKKGNFSVRAHVGDCKTLLAWNLSKNQAKNLAGFTIHYTISRDQSFYIANEWAFEYPEQHAQDAKFPATSSINSPLHKFRWLHIPGSINQGTNPYYGAYVYTLTLRLDMLPCDLSEPDVLTRLLQLAKGGSIRLILDNTHLHHQSKKKKQAKPPKGMKNKKAEGSPAEDQFEKLFLKAAKKGAAIK